MTPDCAGHYAYPLLGGALLGAGISAWLLRGVIRAARKL